MADDNSSDITADKQQNNSRVIGKPWPKGVSGNPAGRPPKGHSLTETILKFMDEKPEIKEAIGKKILQLVLDGDVQTIKTLWNYIDGMPNVSIKHSGDIENPLIIIKNGDQTV